jgi:hypothetical protein
VTPLHLQPRANPVGNACLFAATNGMRVWDATLTLMAAAGLLGLTLTQMNKGI